MQAKGKIIVFDQGFVSYGVSVSYRQFAAKEAAKVGAVATLVKSIASFSIHSPHTGWQVRENTILIISAFRGMSA